MSTKDKKIKGIAKVIRLVRTEEDLVRLLDDIFTDSEIDKAHERVKIIACLKDGLSQRKTQTETDAAIATVSRGAQLLHKPKFILDQIISTAQNMNWWQKLFWRA